jgi:membrane protein YdbS with pleckstrin-like domain
MGLPFDLQSDEQVVLRVRRHNIFLYSKLFLVTLVAVIVAIPLVIVFFPLAIIWIVAVLVYAYFIWYRYHYDEWIVTNQRIIDSLKNHWFHHQMSSADLINVQDMSIVKSGFLATIYNFGDLRCETAGTEQQFVMKNIPNPQKVLDVVDERRDAARRSLAGGANTGGVSG